MGCGRWSREPVPAGLTGPLPSPSILPRFAPGRSVAYGRGQAQEGLALGSRQGFCHLGTF